MSSLLRFAAVTGALLLSTPALAAEVTMTPAEVGSLSVDATVYHLATPDVVNMNVSCEAQEPGSKQEIRATFKEMLRKMSSAVGNGGTVRRNGTPGIYPYYGPAMPYDASGSAPTLFTGNLNVTVLSIRAGEGMRISDAMEEMGCTVSWDARLTYTVKYARELRDELNEQLAEKKLYFEQLLGIRLSKVSNIYVSTSQDSGGYYGGPASYDPESNTLPAMTMLSVTYDIGTGKAQR